MFGENKRCRDRVRFIRELVMEVNKVNLNSGVGQEKRSRVEM